MHVFTFDMNRSLPLNRQLYDYIKSEIQAGRLASGDKLPSKRKLSVHLRISQNTVQTAYDQLAEEGYVQSVERKGYFVNKLDHMVNMNAAKTAFIKGSQPETAHVKYDFSYQGVDLKHFPFTTWRRITREVLNEYDTELLQIGHSQGLSALRESIAGYLRQSRGVNCSSHQIIISSGTEFLFQLIIQLFERDVVYGIENPGHERLSLLFKSNGLGVVPIRIDDNGMVAEDIVAQKAKIVCITPSHQFPTGVIMPVSRRLQLLNWANAGEGRYIIEDDYDSEFKYSGKPIPALQGLDTNGKVIYMGAFSKSLSPALRISYMVLPDHLLEKYKDQLSFFVCPVPTLDQKILIRLMDSGAFERHLNKMRNHYRKKREVLVDALSKLKGKIEILGAEAGLHLLVKVSNGMAEKDLVSTALAKGIKVYPLSRYYPDGASKRPKQKIPLILLGYAALTENEIETAVELLGEAWKKA